MKVSAVPVPETVSPTGVGKSIFEVVASLQDVIDTRGETGDDHLEAAFDEVTTVDDDFSRGDDGVT